MKQKRTVFAALTLILILMVDCGFINTGVKDSPDHALIVYGDTRTNHDNHKKVVEAILKVDPKVVFHVGDLVADGRKQDQWVTFNEITKPLLSVVEFYPAAGNHERNSQLYFDNFELPNNERWYSVEKYGVHFIILDSNADLSDTSAQYAWLENDLQNRSKTAAFTAAVFHHPPYSTGSHKEDEKGLRKTIVPLFEKYGVDIAFSGHDHHYERSLVNGIYYIVTGGGGAPLYDRERESPNSQIFLKELEFCALTVKKDKLKIDVFNEKSELIDNFIVEKR